MCRTDIHTLSQRSKNRERRQVFFECFTFEDEDTEVFMEEESLKVRQGTKRYEFQTVWQEDPASGTIPIKIRIRDEDGREVCYDA